MSRQLSIAIIEADVPLAGTAQRHGSYGGVFSSVLNQAAHTLIPPVSLSLSYHAISMGGTFPSTSALAQLDGIIITGSRASAFDDTPWIVELVAFVRDVLHHHKKVKVVGVCFGHQIIARALGVQVRRGDGWEASVSNVHMTHAGREIFGRDVLSINQMHRDIVTALPRGAVNLGSSSRCAIQGMFDEARGRYISVQGHPEFTPEIVAEILTVRRDAGIFSMAEWQEMMARLKNGHHGTEIAAVFLMFLLGELKGMVKDGNAVKAAVREASAVKTMVEECNAVKTMEEECTGGKLVNGTKA